LIKKTEDREGYSAPKGRAVFDELLGLVSEEVNPRSRNLHLLSTVSILQLINAEDATVAKAVAKEIKYIAKAVEMAVEAIKKGGRIFYLGAGTSGRLGVLDAAECPPTFGTDPKMIVGIIAGGYDSLIRSREGVEDDTAAAEKDLKKAKVKKGDLIIGITASRRTPYVLAGLKTAARLGAKTIFLCCNPRKNVPRDFDLAICPVVGPEIVAGSSRMKAGTAQKMILNMISTAAMIRTGKIYKGRMIDLKAASEKLKERSKRVLMEICGLDYQDAQKLLKSAGGSVKTAIIMTELKISRSRAEKILENKRGFVHKAIKRPK